MMSFFTDLNNYIKTLSSDWVLVDGTDASTIYLENEEAKSRIRIEYHQEMTVRNGKVKPYIWGMVDLIDDGYIDSSKIALEVNEILRKNT